MQTHKSKIVHQIAPGWRLLLYASILITVFLIVGTFSAVVDLLLERIHALELSLIIFLTFTVLFYGFMIFIGIAALKIYAVTSPLGLEYHGIGIHIHTSWENTAQIALVGIAARVGLGAEVMKLSESPQIVSSNRLGRAIFRYQGGIPLLEFGKWRSSPLGSEIQKYAPRLLAR